MEGNGSERTRCDYEKETTVTMRPEEVERGWGGGWTLLALYIGRQKPNELTLLTLTIANMAKQGAPEPSNEMATWHEDARRPDAKEKQESVEDLISPIEGAVCMADERVRGLEESCANDSGEHHMVASL
ncbi:hypothetical protein GW17_00061118 [Ensete ventricosum]|nr:hypothetical protein GW17_00061118 [Ensete ventricosum]